jgi:hypothetical protein
MKKQYKTLLPGILFLAAALMLLPSLCPAMSHKLPVDDVEKLQDYITTENPYEKWELWPGKGKLYEGTQPHGAYLTTYVNDIALAAIQEGKKEFPQGSIIVKENYTGGKELAAITVMYKVEGYNPSGGDWYWLKYKADGSVDASGKVGGCIDCHRAQSGQDWVFTARP